MDSAVLQQLLDEAFDHAVVHHGYTHYMRDYEVIVYATAAPGTGIQPAYLRYLFRYCVEASCETSVPAATWRVSLDDRLVDYETGADLDGYVWGVKWHLLYPGRSFSPSRRWPDAGRRPSESTSTTCSSSPTLTGSPWSSPTFR